MSNLKPVAPTEAFHAALREYGIELEPNEIDQLGRYLALLLEANARMNLTRIVDPAEAWMRHIFDSLTLLPFLVQTNANKVIDVGSGGGTPGIPLAIALPDVRFTLLEATGKKAAFLREVVTALQFERVEIVNERAEEAAAKGSSRRENADLAIARALGPLNVLLELTLPFVKVRGHLLAIKGAKAESEVAEARNALKVLHGEVVNIHDTPTGRIVVIEKIAPTPGRFPRSAGEPKRNPL